MTLSNMNKDWFEFILDFNLLERHLLKQSAPEPSGCSLIVQFLYQANMTEQLYNNTIANANSNNVNLNQNGGANNGASALAGKATTGSESPGQSNSSSANDSNQNSGILLLPGNQSAIPQFESKAKRIKILRILAIKTAAILEWNLVKFEAEIPIAVMSDLLNNFLRLALNDKEITHNSQLDINKLDTYTIFALQLLHRWWLRIVLFSKFPKKPQTKLVPINMPGVLNPLQHMKDANDTILKNLLNNVQESVDFLEKCLQLLSSDVSMPTSECFSNLNAETGAFDLLWTNGVVLSVDEIKHYIFYDLALYYFQLENYKTSFEYFSNVREYLNKTDAAATTLCKLEQYASELGDYLIACKSMLPISGDLCDEVTVKDKYASQVVKKIAFIENSLKKDFKGIFEFLMDDNKTMQLSSSFRCSIELQMQPISGHYEMDQIKSCNIVRLISQSSFFSKLAFDLQNLKHLIQVINNAFVSLPETAKTNVIAFVQLNYLKFNSAYRNELNNIAQFRLPAETSLVRESTADAVDSMMYTPSSPPPTSSLINTLNYRENSILTFAQLALQTCDAIALKNCISKYNFNITNNNQTLSSNSLRFMWPNWNKSVLKLNVHNANTVDSSDTLLISTSFISGLMKSNNINDLDYFFICYAKVNELVHIKKFECAFRLMKAYENILNQNALKNAKVYFNQQLFLNIHYFLHERAKGRTPRLIGSSQLNKERMVKNCKQFLLTIKSEPEASLEMLKTVLAFILTTNEFGLLTSPDVNFLAANQNKKNFNYPSSVLTLFNISKILARLCVELHKADKLMTRKVARELWDAMVELFTDTIIVKKAAASGPAAASSGADASTAAGCSSSSGPSQNTPFDASSAGSFFAAPTPHATSQSSVIVPRDTQISYTNRQRVRELLLLARNRMALGVLVSLLSTMYNIGDAMANSEIHSEYRHLWPSSLANASSLNLHSLTDLLQTLLTDCLSSVDPFSYNWLRANADVNLARAHYSDTLKCLLQVVICESKYLFRSKALSVKSASGSAAAASSSVTAAATLTKKVDESTTPADDRISCIDEKLIKAMIRACAQLNKHTQAALLYQLLSRQNNDYSAAFRYLQDGSTIVPTSDEMDMLYTCVWDITLLEYLTNLNAVRGFINKKNLCLKMCANQNINTFNPAEIYQRNVEAKKSLFFLKLIHYYFAF